jgi:hypothetical protein
VLKESQMSLRDHKSTRIKYKRGGLEMKGYPQKLTSTYWPLLHGQGATHFLSEKLVEKTKNSRRKRLENWATKKKSKQTVELVFGKEKWRKEQKGIVLLNLIFCGNMSQHVKMRITFWERENHLRWNKWAVKNNC